MHIFRVLQLVILLGLAGCRDSSTSIKEAVAPIESLGGTAQVYSGEHLKQEGLPSELRGKLAFVHLDRLNLATINLDHLPLDPVETLSLHSTVVSDEQLAVLGKCDRLEMLTLDGSPITDKALTTIASIKSLKLLYLNRCNITDSGLATLWDHPSLETITLIDTYVTEKGVADLKKRLPNLESVTYSTVPSEEVRKGLAHLEAKGADVGGASATMLAKATEANRLRYFVYFNKGWRGSLDRESLRALSAIMDADRTSIAIHDPLPGILAKLGELDHIHKLAISSEVTCDSHEIMALTSTARITELKIYNAEVATASILHLQRVHGLKRLIMRGLKLTASEATDLSKCESLESLELVESDLSGGVTSLADLKSLKQVTFRNCKDLVSEDVKVLEQHGIEVIIQ